MNVNGTQPGASTGARPPLPLPAMTKHGKRTMALMQQRCSASQAHAFVMNVVTTIPGHNPQTLWDEIARRYKDCINITAHAPLDPPHHLSTATFDQIKRHHADMIAHWTDIWKRLRATGNAGTAPATTTATAGPSTAHSSARDATAASQTLAHVHAPAPKAARSCPRPRAAVHLDRDSIILLASYTYNVDCTKPEYDFYWRFLRGLFYHHKNPSTLLPMANLKALYNRVLLLFPAKLASHNYKADIAYEVDNQICVCGQAPATKPVMSLADTVQHANWLHTSVHALLEMKEALAYVKPVAVVDKPKQTAHAVQPAAVSASTSAEATQKPHVTPSASTFASSSSSISQAINAARQAIQSSSSSTQKLQVTPSTHHASSSSANIHQSRPGSSSQPSSSSTVARASGSQGNSTNYSVSKPVTTPLVSHATAAATPSAAAQNVQPNDADLDIPPAADELTVRKATPAEIDELLALIPGFDRSKAIAISGHHYDFIRDGPNDNEPVILADFNLSDELDDYQFDSWTDMSGTPRAFFYLAFANPMGKLQLQQSIELLDSAELSINDHALSIADLGEVTPHNLSCVDLSRWVMADDADSFFFSDRLGNNEHGVFAIVFRSDASRETLVARAYTTTAAALGLPSDNMSLSDLEMCRKSFLQAARENSTVGPLRTPSDDADDGELLVADETLSLTCPLTLTRLVYAVKGKDCTHRQCFDMMNFLNMPAVLTNANTYEYGKGPKDPECPVCGVAVKIEDLRPDPFMHKTLADHPNADAVVVRADGSVATKEDSRKHSLVADDGPSAKRQCMTLLGTEDGEVDEFDDDYDEEESRFQMDDVDENGHQIIWLD